MPTRQDLAEYLSPDVTRGRLEVDRLAKDVFRPEQRVTVHGTGRRREDVRPLTGSRQFADKVLGRRACSGIICLLKGN